jgi:hypothetical protein
MTTTVLNQLMKNGMKNGMTNGMTDRADRASAHFPNTQLLNLQTYGAPLAVGCRSKVDHPIRIKRASRTSLVDVAGGKTSMISTHGPFQLIFAQTLSPTARPRTSLHRDGDARPSQTRARRTAATSTSAFGSGRVKSLLRRCRASRRSSTRSRSS